MPTFAAKLLLLLAIGIVAAWHISGRSLLPGRRRQPLDAASAAVGVLFAYSIAINALGYLTDAYVYWLCGEHDTAPTTWDLCAMQLQVFAVVVPVVAAMFRELRKYLDHPGEPPQRLGFAVLHAGGALVAAVPLYWLADHLPGWLATAAQVAASSFVLLAFETLLVAAVVFGRVHGSALPAHEDEEPTDAAPASDPAARAPAEH